MYFQILVKCATSEDINEKIRKRICSNICVINLLVIKWLGERLLNETYTFAKNFPSQNKMLRIYIYEFCYLVD